MILLRN